MKLTKLLILMTFTFGKLCVAEDSEATAVKLCLVLPSIDSLSFDFQIKSTGKQFQVDLTSSTKYNQGTGNLDSQVGFKIRDGKSLIWSDSINSEYSTTSSKKDNSIVLSEFVGTKKVSNREWRVVRQTVVRGADQNGPQVTDLWLIIINGNTGKKSILDIPSESDLLKDYFVKDLELGSLLFVKIGSIGPA